MISEIYSIIGGIAVILAVGFGLWFKGKSTGAKEQKMETDLKIAEKQQEAQTISRKNENEAASKSDAALNDSLSEWLRK